MSRTMSLFGMINSYLGTDRRMYSESLPPVPSDFMMFPSPNSHVTQHLLDATGCRIQVKTQFNFLVNKSHVYRSKWSKNHGP